MYVESMHRGKLVGFMPSYCECKIFVDVFSIHDVYLLFNNGEVAHLV